MQFSSMSRSIHFISKSIPGCGPPDGRRVSRSGVSGRGLCISPNSSLDDLKLSYDVKFLSLRTASRYKSTVCDANSSNYMKNPDFSRHNKHGFSRRRNRKKEVRDENEDLQESEAFSSRNGPVLSVSGNKKFQATATPGPREKEIVELFQKVQAQLRERAAMKEGRKTEDSQGKSKESETVDSLLKLLRKHSVQQGKKSGITAASNRDFFLDQNGEVDPLTEDKSTSISDSTSSGKHEMQESSRTHLSRPKSNFSRRSPVPQVKFQPVYPSNQTSISEDNLDGESKWISLQPEDDDTQDVEYDSDSDVESVISEEKSSDEVSDDKISDIGETEHDDVANKQNLVEASDLHGMKLTELRALAKSRGMKGFSKLKKSELIELLNKSI